MDYFLARSVPNTRMVWAQGQSLNGVLLGARHSMVNWSQCYWFRCHDQSLKCSRERFAVIATSKYNSMNATLSPRGKEPYEE